MRRRSLFAGLAGLLAAPKVAAAQPAGLVETYDSDGRLLYYRIRGTMTRFFVDEWKLPDGVVRHEIRMVGCGGQSSSGIVDLAADEAVTPQAAAPCGPIGIAWSGYADPDPRSLVSPPHGLERAAAGGEDSPLAAGLLASHSLHLQRPRLQGPDTPEIRTGGYP